VLLFYTQVLGLSGAATGAILFIGLLWDAVSDPLIGIWSDRLRTRWGRRHPMMLAAALPLGVGFIALFAPPPSVVDDKFLLGSWLLFWSLWIRTSITLFSMPHLALVAEISSDYHERSSLLALRMGFMFLTAVLLPAGALWLLFGVTDGGDGRFVATNYPLYGWASCIVVLLAAAGCIWGTRKNFVPVSRLVDSGGDDPGLRGMFRDFVGTLRIRNFRYVLLYDLASSTAYGILVALNILAWTYYWELSAIEVSLVMALPSLLAVPLAVWSMGPLGRRWAKHKILNTAIALMILDAVWVFPLRQFELIPDNGHPLVFAALFLQMFIWMYLFVLRVVAAFSITADVTDEHELEHGTRQEGGFFSALTFTSKLASALGPLYGGVILDLIGLEEGMLPGAVSQSTLDGLAVAMAAGVIPPLILAWYFSFHITMSEARLKQIQADLALKSS
jgi:GPH family glycoside/pentoside/hexuronide:cation symporter